MKKMTQNNKTETKETQKLENKFEKWSKLAQSKILIQEKIKNYSNL